jgi:hypothetical protein
MTAPRDPLPGGRVERSFGYAEELQEPDPPRPRTSWRLLVAAGLAAVALIAIVGMAVS